MALSATPFNDVRAFSCTGANARGGRRDQEQGSSARNGFSCDFTKGMPEITFSVDTPLITPASRHLPAFPGSSPRLLEQICSWRGSWASFVEDERHRYHGLRRGSRVGFQPIECRGSRRSARQREESQRRASDRRSELAATGECSAIGKRLALSAKDLGANKAHLQHEIRSMM